MNDSMGGTQHQSQVRQDSPDKMDELDMSYVTDITPQSSKRKTEQFVVDG